MVQAPFSASHVTQSSPPSHDVRMSGASGLDEKLSFLKREFAEVRIRKDRSPATPGGAARSQSNDTSRPPSHEACTVRSSGGETKGEKKKTFRCRPGLHAWPKNILCFVEVKGDMHQKEILQTSTPRETKPLQTPAGSAFQPASASNALRDFSRCRLGQ